MITRTHTTDDRQIRSAVYSDDERHRFSLHIVWVAQPVRLVQFIGLNPSTATELADDPTVLRCRNRAKALGFEGMVMTNLFSFRATNPVEMKAQPDEPMLAAANIDYLRATADQCELIVLCWGAMGAHFSRAGAVLRALAAHRGMFRCLGVTASGHPKHPLYVRNDAELQQFRSYAGNTEHPTSNTEHRRA